MHLLMIEDIHPHAAFSLWISKDLTFQ